MRYKVRQMKEPAPRPRRTRLTRRSTRRSGYAFSHAHGYGDLVTSGRFLRRQAPARSMGLIPTGRSPGFKPTGRSAGYSPVGQEQNPKQKVEPTSLQMFRAVKDSSFWGCSFSTRARTKTLNAVYRVWTLGDIFTAAVLCVYSRILYIRTLRTKDLILKCTKSCWGVSIDTFVTQNASVVYSTNKLKYPSHWRTERIYLSFLLSSLQRERQTNLTTREQKQWHVVHDIIEEVMSNRIQNTVSCSFPLPGAMSTNSFDMSPEFSINHTQHVIVIS